jgi:hypothetical protein
MLDEKALELRQAGMVSVNLIAATQYSITNIFLENLASAVQLTLSWVGRSLLG